jgi:hypothetical protein
VAQAQHVPTDPGDHRGQPASEVLHGVAVGAIEPQPGLLDGVVGLVAGSQRPERNRPEVLAMSLEALGERSHSLTVTSFGSQPSYS